MEKEKKFSPARFWGKTILGFLCLTVIVGLVFSALYLGGEKTARQVSFASVVFTLAISAGIVAGMVRFFKVLKKSTKKEESNAKAE